MEKHTTVVLALVFTCICLCTQLWVWLLLCALLSPIPLKWQRTVPRLIMIPVIGLILAWVSGSVPFIVLWGGLLILYRMDTETASLYTWKESLAIALLGGISILYMPHLTLIAVIALLLIVPIKYKIKLPVRKDLSILSSTCLIFGVALALVFGFQRNRKSAYLHHGVWARSDKPYRLDSLNNASGYSYSEFTKAIAADTITSLQGINEYNELWVVTPTHPFSQQEQSAIRKWVASGGHLFIVNDHTDLFGHARACNSLAHGFGLHIRNTALFREDSGDPYFLDAWGKLINIKTGSGASAIIAMPIASAWLWEEGAYYAQNNFFGPLTASGDDSYGLKLLAGQIPWGLGQVSFIQDSTILSNFAVYQPGILSFIDRLVNSRFLAYLYALLPIIFVLMLLIKQCWTFFITPMALIGQICLNSFIGRGNISYGMNAQIWTGDISAVAENGCPYRSISTAYAIACLSGRTPRWIENLSPNASNDVIYVGELPPANNRWRWIKIKDNHKEYREASQWAQLEASINAVGIRNIQSQDSTILSATGCINDRALGDFWFNRGISKAKEMYFSMWLKWLNPVGYNGCYPISLPKVTYTNELYRAILYLDKEGPREIQIPKPLAGSGQIYLGNGVSAELLTRGDTLSLLGYKAYQLNYLAPSMWVIDYLPR